jgi:O-acetyl-ADP-ribose deacetylase (regulator of RNase III)
MENCFIQEIKGDLFEYCGNSSLVHCVAEDFVMGAGIAIQFRERFGNVKELKSQKKTVGDCAYINISNKNDEKERYAFYLITKKISVGPRPTLKALEKSLFSLRDAMIELGINNISMPRIGCRLDKLKWIDVKPIILRVFENMKISIKIIDFNN